MRRQKQPASVRVRTRDLIAAVGFIVRLAWRADRLRMLGIILAQFVSAAGLGGIVLLARNVLGGALPVGTGRGGAAANTDALIPGIMVLVGFGAVGAILRTVSQAWQRVLALQVDRSIVATVLESAGRAELATFERPTFHDRLQRAIFASRNQPMILVTTLSGALQAVLGLLVVGGVFVVMAWWLLPLCALSILPALKAARDERNARYGLHQDLAEERRVRDYLERLLTGRDEAKEVRAFGLGGLLRDRWSGIYRAEIERTAAMQRTHTRRTIGARLLGSLVTVALIGIIWWFIQVGSLSLPTGLAALTGLWLLTNRLQMLGHLFNAVGDSMLYLQDLRSFSTSDEPAAALLRPPDAGTAGVEPFRKLRAERVGFGYPESDRSVLHDVTVRLGAGEIVALVGPNGSGKTTLAKLLAGLYSPDTGGLVYNDEPLEDPNSLRESTAVVFQDFLRYKLPATDNISFGRADVPVDLEQVRAAAEQAGIDEVLQGLPRAYETVLSKEFSDGADLSLGQWQRLALARAFYRDAPFVILDEPTASLDPQSEAELFGRIRELFVGRTVLLISHRFSTVRGADRIYVLDAGRVIEHGTHESLLAEGGTYARLFRLQADAYRDDPATPSAITP